MSEAVNKAKLAEKVSQLTGQTQGDALKSLDAVFTAIQESLQAGSEVNIYGFGKFKVKTRKARKGVNPKTGEKIEISERRHPTFKAGKGLQDLFAA